MACYTSLSSAPSAHLHVSYTSHLHIQDVNNSTGAHFLTDDHSLSGDGIPNFKARITGPVTEVKDINTDLKDIKTEAKTIAYALQTIQKEIALQTSQRQQVIDAVGNFFVGVLLGITLLIGGVWIFICYQECKMRGICISE
jgi:uncharacterized protein (UPF0335 family)